MENFWLLSFLRLFSKKPPFSLHKRLPDNEFCLVEPFQHSNSRHLSKKMTKIESKRIKLEIFANILFLGQFLGYF